MKKAEGNENICKVHYTRIAYNDDKTSGVFSSKQKWDDWTG